MGNEKKQMSQEEFDIKMQKLNTAMEKETSPFSERRKKILAVREEIQRNIASLRIRYKELGKEYYDLCSQSDAVRKKYHHMKDALNTEFKTGEKTASFFFVSSDTIEQIEKAVYDNVALTATKDKKPLSRFMVSIIEQ